VRRRIDSLSTIDRGVRIAFSSALDCIVAL
jgi:hypothetical protein